MKTATKQLSYLQRQQLSQEDKSSQDLIYKAEAANLQLKSDILATEQSVMECTMAVDTAMTAYPFNTQAIINAQTALENAEDGLKRAKALAALLFPA